MSNTSKNADRPAMPVHDVIESCSADGNQGPYLFTKVDTGLTKREEFAKTAMMGLLSNPSMIDSVTNLSIDWLADASILIADKILTDLEK